MATIDPQVAAASGFVEGGAAPEVETAPVPNGTGDPSATTPSPVPIGSNGVEGASTTSEDLTTLLRESEAMSSAAATSKNPAGLTKVVEGVVALVAKLVSLISSLLAEQKSTSAASDNSATGSSGSTSSSKTTAAGSGTGSTAAENAPTESAKQVATIPAAAPARLQAIADETGRITVRTPDGFMIKTENQQQAWQIIGPDGRATRIWGDPHVHESDGNKWDFQKQSTFVFGTNKVTVETAPYGNGKTVTRRLTVYNGNDRVTIGGINVNSPSILAVGSDGKQHDDGLSDGVRFTRRLTKTGESWSKNSGGRADVMGR